jgi:hypothetical protein
MHRKGKRLHLVFNFISINTAASLAMLIIAAMVFTVGCRAVEVAPAAPVSTADINTQETAAESKPDNVTDNSPVSSTSAQREAGSNNKALEVPAGLTGSAMLGAPTENSIIINILAEKGMEASVEYGNAPGSYNLKTEAFKSGDGAPIVIEISQLDRDTEYFYRINYKLESESNYIKSPEYSFHTRKEPGAVFSFGVQGDSHPERAGKMFNSGLYQQTMKNVLQAMPDFYFTMGDDFSIEHLIEKNQASQETVNEVYLGQRSYLDIIGAYSPVFLVNGNHEQAAKYLLDGTADNPAVYAAKARAKYYPLPFPGDFYSGDSEKITNIGLPGDYYSFEWGDALFIVIDPYWHSDIPVDNTAGADKGDNKKSRDLWQVTLGDEQYKWFKTTLENSTAKYKFVFCHHVLGTGRGGIEEAKLFEWGGNDTKGIYEFDKMRPGWEMPIHDLMVKNGVTIFFQGHDHLFARQELDGVIYQEVPCPADNTYTAFNKDAYKSGDIFQNSGFLNVTVSSEGVRVDYIGSFLQKDEAGQNKNNMSIFSYTIE